MGRAREAEEFLQQHSDQPSDAEFWDLDPDQLWFLDDTTTGEVEYKQSDVAKFDRGCFNGEYVPVLADGATVGWPHYLNGFGRFLTVQQKEMELLHGVRSAVGHASQGCEYAS